MGGGEWTIRMDEDILGSFRAPKLPSKECVFLYFFMAFKDNCGSLEKHTGEVLLLNCIIANQLRAYYKLYVSCHLVLC